MPKNRRRDEDSRTRGEFNNEPEIEENHMTTKRVIIVAKRRDCTKAVSDISGIGVIEGDGVGAQVER